METAQEQTAVAEPGADTLAERRRAYDLAMQFDKPLGVHRTLVWTPAAAEMEKRNSVHKWLQWGPFLTLDQYDGEWAKEISALRSTAVLGDWSPLGKYVIEGPDASRYVDYLAARDMASMEVGQIVYAPFLNEDGKMVHDFPCARLASDTYRITPDKLDLWLHHVREAGDFQVEIKDIRADFCLLSLQGPQSTAILEALTGESWTDLRFSRIRMTEACGFALEVSRQGFTGEVGYELIADARRGNELYRRLLEVGEAFGARPLSNYASRLARVEAGLTQTFFDYRSAGPDARNAGHIELGEAGDPVSPFEIGLGRLVDLTKQSFIGRDAITKQVAAGETKRTFVGVMLDSKDVVDLFARQLADGDGPPALTFPHVLRPEARPLTSDGRHVGWATSLTYSPTVRRMVAFGRIERAVAEPGERLVLQWPGAEAPNVELGATVVPLPFVARRRASA